MQDIIWIKLLFVAGLLVMSGVLALLAYGIVRLEERQEARGRAVRPPQRSMKNMPLGGTR